MEAIQSAFFDSSIHPALPVESVGLADLTERMARSGYDRPVRVDFPMLLVVTAGVLTPRVDMAAVKLRRSGVLIVQPGQILELGGATGRLDGVVLMGRRDLPMADAWSDGTARVGSFADPELAVVVALADAVGAEQARFEADEISIGVMIDLFSACLGYAARVVSPGPTENMPEAYLAFRDAIESGLGTSRDARDHIRRTGYSERTVIRACQQARGLTAKGVLDDRIMLEARRLLLHTDSSISAIAARLGFHDPSNFNKFFARLDGAMPSTFRSAMGNRADDMPSEGASA